MLKYRIPSPLLPYCDQATYSRWLDRTAHRQVDRDRERGNEHARVAEYKEAIHAAVVRDGVRDAYTGTLLSWDLISTYDNTAARLGGRAYKHRMRDLPTVDHVEDGMGPPKFRICSYSTNDAKNDLSLDDFIELSRRVVAHATQVNATDGENAVGLQEAVDG
jgi:hypothetical protein